MRMIPETVGFDLDMTLIDSRPQILEAFHALSEESHTAIDLAEVDARLGLKLEDELANWFPPAAVQEAANVYRRHYITLASRSTRALPGAHDALAAVHAAGARVAIVTAKHEVSVQPCLASAGLKPDMVFSFVYGSQKTDVLRSIGATIYVGDTPADMAAGRDADLVTIGVATGSFSQDDLQHAGASITFATLTAFPSWYERFVDTKPRG